MVDPGYILYRLNELMADLRTWHYRVSDLVQETQACARYSKEILERTEHEVLCLRDYVTADLERYRQMHLSADDLEQRSSTVQTEANILVNTAREVKREAVSVRTRCEEERRKAEDAYREARHEERVAQHHMQECQKTVEMRRRVVNEKRKTLAAAERELQRACEALERAAASRRADSERSVDLSGYKSAVAHSEAKVASCRCEYESASADLASAEVALDLAKETLALAVKRRDAAERRLGRCKDACVHADQAVSAAEHGLELVNVVLRDVEELLLNVHGALDGCRRLIEAMTTCLTHVQGMQDQLQMSWRVFNGTMCDIQNLTESGDTGMNCCQHAIVDLGARCLSLARFEEATVTDWRL